MTVPIPAINRMTHPLWIAENLMTHPLPRAQKLMSPPPILFDQSLRGGIIRPSYKYFKENLFIGK